MTEPTWPAVALLALSTLQTIALAYISSRSRRVRSTDTEGPSQDE